MSRLKISRRQFIQSSALSGVALSSGVAGILAARQAPAAISSDASRPSTQWGIQIGDVLNDRAIVWSRTDRPARLMVEWSLDEQFSRPVRVRGPSALDASDFTARVDLDGLPADADVFVRAGFETLDSSRTASEQVLGKFRTPPRRSRDLRVLWSGDTVGQGWGINPDLGGMKIYDAMRRTQADFFIHSGDTIYADGPLAETVADPSTGVTWRNAFLDVVPEKLVVAQSLNGYRRHHLYNRYDTNLQRFTAEVPQVWQWDDHEVVNNWSDSKVLPPVYTERNVRTLAAYANRAFLEYAPLRWHNQTESERVYRHIPYGRDLDVFVLDMRTYRGPNGFNRETAPSDVTAFLGRTQLEWLKRKLSESRAAWKVIAADMPIGLLVPDGNDSQGRPQFEAIANGDGPVLGREFEIAELLRFIKREDIVNTVWITADVHYCAAHYYDPHRAQFQDFDPFWEFVAGPLNAGSFGPNVLDNTFGPQLVFQKVPPVANASPAAGFQFFGQLDLDSRSKELTVSLKDLNGATVFSKRLQPQFAHRFDRRWDID